MDINQKNRMVRQGCRPWESIALLINTFSKAMDSIPIVIGKAILPITFWNDGIYIILFFPLGRHLCRTKQRLNIKGRQENQANKTQQLHIYFLLHNKTINFNNCY